MEQLSSYMRAAIDKYSMIEDGDRIAVGISGGKDSLAMLVCLANIRRYYPKKFEIVALAIDPCFFGEPSDYSFIQKLCDEIGVELVIKRTELYHIIFETRKEKNPCSLCARMRRGILHDAAKENGCNKLSLGHHMDDAAETFMMNLLSGGTIGSFRPVTYLSRKDIYVIRPMIFARENVVEKTAEKLKLPVIVSRCPMDKTSERQTVKELLDNLDKDYPGVYEKITSAMQKSGITGW